MAESSTSLKCEVCGKPAIGVCSSSLGPVSHAWCESCLVEGIHPWTTMIGALCGLLCKEDIRPEVWKEIIEPTLNLALVSDLWVLFRGRYSAAPGGAL